MSHYDVNPDARALEDAFFAEQDKQLLERLRKKAEQQERREALRKVAPNAPDAVLDHFIELGIGPSTVLAVVLVPLAMVAWADGEVEERERRAILQAAASRGVEPGSEAQGLLESWLERKPPPAMINAWKTYVKSLTPAFEEAERTAMRKQIVGMARDVAQAAGGFLGMTSAISPAERAVLEEIEAVLS